MPQPRYKRYNRKQRLIHGPIWIKSYTGKKLYRGYAKHFGVDKLCAVTELEMLGVVFPPNLKEELRRCEKNLRKKKILKCEPEDIIPDWDCDFAFIAGYTSGGAPYGVTWEEMGKI
jgi:hypothetical protein